jgi:hypothetical protein
VGRLVEVVSMTHAVRGRQCVADMALQQCVAGMVHNTGGIVRS